MNGRWKGEVGKGGMGTREAERWGKTEMMRLIIVTLFIFYCEMIYHRNGVCERYDYTVSLADGDGDKYDI
jgi:hypothetical protein